MKHIRCQCSLMWASVCFSTATSTMLHRWRRRASEERDHTCSDWDAPHCLHLHLHDNGIPSESPHTGRHADVCVCVCVPAPPLVTGLKRHTSALRLLTGRTPLSRMALHLNTIVSADCRNHTRQAQANNCTSSLYSKNCLKSRNKLADLQKNSA